MYFHKVFPCYQNQQFRMSRNHSGLRVKIIQDIKMISSLWSIVKHRLESFAESTYLLMFPKPLEKFKITGQPDILLCT